MRATDPIPAAPTRPLRRAALRLSLGLAAAGASLGGLFPIMAAADPTRHGAQPRETNARGIAPSSAPGTDALHWRERVMLGFGTTLWLRAAHSDASRLDRALDAAVAELRDIEASLSLFDPQSALSRLNRSGELPRPDAHLRSVLASALDMARASDGAFDPTVQPLWACWAEASRERRMPTQASLKRACAQVGWRGVRLSESAIRYEQPGMAMTLNGIAQGYAADRVAMILRAHGIEQALIDTGEWATRGSAPEHEGWRLGVENPFAPEHLLCSVQIPPGRCAAASSFTHQRFSADGRQHHILDPRTGHSPPAVAAVAVVADSARLADALTKVMFMAGPHAALRVAAHWRVQVFLLDTLGRRHVSGGMRLIG
ncbi:MAG: FAD:protein FMN transferase [Burkholderiaceae bacterium]